MPFSDGKNRIRLDRSIVRVMSANADGVHLEILPTRGPIGGISVFINRASLPDLLAGVAACLALQETTDPSERPLPPAPHDVHPAEETARSGAPAPEGAPADSAAEIWLRGAAPSRDEGRYKDVLDPPSFWRRRRS